MPFPLLVVVVVVVLPFGPAGSASSATLCPVHDLRICKTSWKPIPRTFFDFARSVARGLNLLTVAIVPWNIVYLDRTEVTLNNA